MEVAFTWLVGLVAFVGVAVVLSLAAMICFAEDGFFREVREGFLLIVLIGATVCGILWVITWGMYSVGRFALGAFQ